MREEHMGPALLPLLNPVHGNFWERVFRISHRIHQIMHIRLKKFKCNFDFPIAHDNMQIGGPKRGEEMC